MNHKFPRALLIILCCIPALARATPLTLDATLLGQDRQNTSGVTEMPTNAYLGAGLGKQGDKISAQTNMRFVRDLKQSIQDYDLFQAVLHTEPLETLKLDFGRQFLTEGFSAQIMDGLKTTLFPEGPVAVTAYSGIPRTVERGDFNADDGLLTGLTIGSDSTPGSHLKLHAAWQKQSLQKMKFKKYDEVRVGANLSHAWTVTAQPILYGLIEYEATSQTVEAGTVGLDLSPSRRLSVNLEGNLFDINRLSNRPTIMSLFTEGRTYSGRIATTVTLIPDWLDWMESYALQRVEIQKGTTYRGHLLETGFPVSFEDIGLHLLPTYYFADSFGGRLHGGRLSAREDFTEKFYAEAGSDFATYTKITKDNDTAVATFLWTGFKHLNGFSVAAGAEYNRNNLLQKDVRGMLRLDYHFDHDA